MTQAPKLGVEQHGVVDDAHQPTIVLLRSSNEGAESVIIRRWGHFDFAVPVDLAYVICVGVGFDNLANQHWRYLF